MPPTAGPLASQARGRPPWRGFAEVSAALPDTCRPAVVAAQRALAAADSEATALRDAAQAARQSTIALQAGYDSLAEAGARQAADLARLAPAAEHLVAAARPSLLRRLLPHAGVGVAVGVSPTKQIDTVAGLSFGWNF
jgi:hypothetical protein